MGHLSAGAKIFSIPVILAAATIGWGQAAHAAVQLPDCNDPVNCLQFEDFSVYSLALLNAISGTDDFDQRSTPGYLNKNAITIGTGANGVKNGNDFIDDPYDTPNNVPHGTAVNYESITLKDPKPNFPADGDNSVTTPVGGVDVGGDMWDATTEALRSFFEPGEDVVFYFNLNETNKGGLDDGQDMYGWLQVTLTDLDNVLADAVFTLSGALGFSGGDEGGSAAQTAGVDDILPQASDLWAHVHGEICVDDTNQADPFVHFGPCVGGDPANANTVNQNLGADHAAFALFNQNLSDLILNSGYDLVSVDLRMAHIDNGFEQLFILPTCVGTDLCQNVEVPEPSTIAMFTLGLFGLASLMMRRRAV